MATPGRLPAARTWNGCDRTPDRRSRSEDTGESTRNPRRMADDVMRLPTTCRSDQSGYVSDAEPELCVTFGASPFSGSVPRRAHWRQSAPSPTASDRPFSDTKPRTVFFWIMWLSALAGLRFGRRERGIPTHSTPTAQARFPW